MDINRFTEKAQEALQGHRKLAVRAGHQQVDNEHLLMSMLEQDKGLAPAILQKVGVSIDPLQIRVKRNSEKLPRSPAQPAVPINFTHGPAPAPLTQAEDEAKKLKDDFVSVEHLLLALTDDGGAAGKILKEFGVSRDRLLKGLQESAVINGSLRKIRKRPIRPSKNTAAT